MKDYLFVYGTLKKEFAPPEIAGAVRELRYVGDGYMHGRLYDLGSFPGVIVKRGIRNKVFGRIYELPDNAESVLPQLDDYEEFYPGKKRKSLFVRRRVNIHRTGHNQTLRSWAYVYNRAVTASPLIAGGDYSLVAV